MKSLLSATEIVDLDGMVLFPNVSRLASDNDVEASQRSTEVEVRAREQAYVERLTRQVERMGR
jgi:hypothetical protein